ncbi:unnamed protein product, partial [Oppiella nova]
KCANEYNVYLTVIHGPACSDDLQVVGRLASYKGIPLLTGLGDVISGERSTYSTLIRASYDLWDEARAILAFLSHLNWYHFGLIYRQGDVYYQTLAEQLLSLLTKPEYSDRFDCTCKDVYVRDINKTILTDLDKKWEINIKADYNDLNGNVDGGPDVNQIETNGWTPFDHKKAHIIAMVHIILGILYSFLNQNEKSCQKKVRICS